MNPTTGGYIADPQARRDQLAAEIRAKTAQGSATKIINMLAGTVAGQAADEFPELDPRTLGAVLMDAAIRLQVMVAETDWRMTSQAVVSVLAASGERLYTGPASDPAGPDGRA